MQRPRRQKTKKLEICHIKLCQDKKSPFNYQGEVPPCSNDGTLRTSSSKPCPEPCPGPTLPRGTLWEKVFPHCFRAEAAFAAPLLPVNPQNLREGGKSTRISFERHAPSSAAIFLARDKSSCFLKAQRYAHGPRTLFRKRCFCSLMKLRVCVCVVVARPPPFHSAQQG